MRSPSAFTRSGSSTPASCTLVPDTSAVVVAGEVGAGACATSPPAAENDPSAATVLSVAKPSMMTGPPESNP